MSTFTEALRDRLPGEYFSDTEVRALVPGSDHSRYGLMKRAIAKEEILAIRRGIYAFGKRYQRRSPNLFELAQRIYFPSYVSLESALSYHGWIPEAAYTTASISAKRSQRFETPLGLFTYARLPRFHFDGVERIENQGTIFLMATPAKAIADYVLVNKVEVKSPRKFLESLRLEEEHLAQLLPSALTELAQSYRSKRLARFARQFAKEKR